MKHDPTPETLYPTVDPAALSGAALDLFHRGYRYAGRWSSLDSFESGGPEMLGICDRPIPTNQSIIVLLPDAETPAAHVWVHPYAVAAQNCAAQ